MNRKSTFFVFAVAGSVLLASFAWAQGIPSNVTNKVALDRMSSVLKVRAKADRAKAESLARKKNFPVRQELKGGKIIELQRLSPLGLPVYYQTDNVDAADTISTDEVQVGGSTGLGLSGSGLKIGEWDGGIVRPTHNELNGRITQIDAPASISDHSTHVAGTMIASGVDAAAKGMATAAVIDAYDFNSDTAEMAAAASGLLLSNHSYGLITGWIFDYPVNKNGWTWFGELAISATEDYNFGFYNTNARDWDQIAFDAPYYLIVKSAGNDRNDTEPGAGGSHSHWNGSSWVTATDTHDADCGTVGKVGYDCVAGSGVAKNILTVGAVDDIIGGYSTSADVVMSDFSGWGSADDGRIKPDVVANGISLYSSFGTNNKAYGIFSGTSMSAPNATGSLSLLQQHYQNIQATSMRSASLKALVIHTADEAGLADGPDYEYGWGLMNTESAARVITENGGAHRIIEDSLINGGIFSTQINVNEPDAVVTATLVWTDPPGTPVAASLDPTDKMLVNDLDLRIIDSSGTYMPWVLDLANPASPATKGDNSTDNVEQVKVVGGTPGAYSVEVTHKGTLLNSASQNFSLIISVESRQLQSIVFDENFTGGLPAGWSVIDNTNAGAVWVFDDPANRTNLTGGTGQFAIVDSDDAGNPNSTDSELRTASYDLSGYTSATLRFNSDFNYYGVAPDEIADVDVSIDGGNNWSNVWQRTGADDRGPTSQNVDLTTVAAGQADVRVRFHYYNAGWDWWWQVDDVQIAGQSLAGDVCGNNYNLPANQWRLISLPCDPGAANTVNDLFGDDFSGGYNVTWVLYERDEVNDRYARLDLTSPLNQGLGYWIYSTETTLLDMTGTATTLISNTDCSSATNRCFEIPLEKPVVAATTLYNMLGHPFPYPVNWANVRITAAGDAASPFTPSGAETAIYFSKNVYTYTGNSYAVYDDITPGYEEGAIGAWDGFFVEVLDGSSSTGNLRLLIPPERSLGVITTALLDVAGQSESVTVATGSSVRLLDILNFLIYDGVANVSRQWKKKQPGLEKRRAHRKKHRAEIRANREWYVRLIVDVEQEELRDEGNVLGQLDDSQPGFDHHDLKELSPNIPYLTLVFPHPDWGENADDYTSDYHPISKRRKGDRWTFEVRTDDPDRVVALSWEGDKKVLRKSRLIDKQTGKRIRPRPDGVYEFVMGAEVREFEWIFRGKGRK